MTHFTIQRLYENYKFHFVIWSLYILSDVFILGFAYEFKEPGVYVIVYFTNILAFYIYAFLLKKTLGEENNFLRKIKISILVILVISVYTIFSYLLVDFFEYLNLIASAPKRKLNQLFILNAVYRAILYIGYATGYVYVIKSFEDRKKVEALERQSLVTQIEKQAL